MQNPTLDPVPGLDGPEDDVIEGGGEREREAPEDEISRAGEADGVRFGGEGVELDAAEAAGLPVLAVAGDFAGEDRGFSDQGLEEVEEVLRRGCAGDV